MARTGSCVDCDNTVYGGKAGSLPQRCPECKRLRNNHLALESQRKRKPFDGATVCVDCGVTFTRDPHATTRVRCDECREEYARGQRREWSRDNLGWYRQRYYREREQRAPYLKANKHATRVKPGAVNVRYSRDEIFERDQWVCYLCGSSVDRTLEFPDPGSASLDHVVTLSRGGDNAPHNVRLAHMGCNWDKNVEDAPETQVEAS